LVTLPSQKVPNLQGASVSEAKQEIKDGGWKTKVIALPSDYQAGQIIKQWPNAGKVLADGRRIKLWVAAPKLDAEVPDTVGLDPETAREVLAASGLRMSENTVAQGPSNQIQSSLPASGQPVRKGSLVQITVAP
jgi:serine/threonine-protein kinase